MSTLRSNYIVLFMGVCMNSEKYMLITELLGTSVFDLLHMQKKPL